MRRRLQAVTAALVLVAGTPAGALAGMSAGNAGVLPPAPVKASAPVVEATDTQEVKFTRDEAIALARQTFGIPEGLEGPTVSLNQSTQPGARSTWSLFWRTPDQKLPYVSYNVQVDAVTGEILSYTIGRKDTAAADLKYTRSEAQALAAEWVKKLLPRYQPLVRLKEQNQPEFWYGGNTTTHSFQWERLEGEVAVNGNGIHVTIDARTGELSNFNLNWDSELKFQTPARSVEELRKAQAEAEKALRAGAALELGYVRLYKPAVDKPEWALVYQPYSGPSLVVDAGTLELLDPWGRKHDPGSAGVPTPLPAPPQPYQKPAQPLTREQALAVAQAAVGRTDPPTDSSYREVTEPVAGQTWDFNWSQEAGGVNASVDAVRAVVTQMSAWKMDEKMSERKDPPPVSEEAARKIAQEFLLTHRPDLAPNLLSMPRVDYWPRFEEKEPPRVNWDFQFRVMHEGIPFLDNQVQVAVDAHTGEIRNMWTGDLDREQTVRDLPAASGAVAPEAALDALRQYQGLQLVWQMVSTEPSRLKMAVAGPVEARLVWVPAAANGDARVEALTGRIIDGQGRDLVELSRKPADIDGHWAQKEIELLLTRGVLETKEGKVAPEARVTAAEAARWLVLARGMRPYMAFDFAASFGAGHRSAAENLAKSKEVAYFGAAFQAGILTPADLPEGDPNAPVSREQFSLWAVRGMGYGAIAKMEVQIPLSFQDADQVTAEYRNAVALLAGLKVIQGGGGQMRPQDVITRAEAAKILYAVATERNEGYPGAWYK